MVILSIDPDSKCFGFAKFLEEKLVSFGCAEEKKGDFVSRAVRLGDNLLGLCELNKPDKVVIEIGKATYRRGAGGRAANNLAHYHMAIGHYLATLEKYGLDYEAVAPNQWMSRRGRSGYLSKGDVRLNVQLKYPDYRLKTNGGADFDKGSHISDAIGIGDWYITNSKIRGAG